MKIETLVCEDDDQERALLCQMLESYDSLELVGVARNGEEGEKLIEARKPQLVFLDIDMPLKTGLELIEDLKKKGITPYYIFVSGHGSYAVHAWDIGAVDFLAKPVTPGRLSLALERAIAVIGDNSGKKAEAGFSIKNGRNQFIVSYNQIVYISSSKRHSVLHTLDGDYEVVRMISELENSLPAGQFLRIHKQYIVNLDYIHRLESLGSGRYNVYLADDLDILPAGASYSKELLSVVNKSGK